VKRRMADFIEKLLCNRGKPQISNLTSDHT
jgi:hypothetical protein